MCRSPRREQLRHIPLDQIVPAPWQPRAAAAEPDPFLLRSIGGDDDAAGPGAWEPVLVRRLGPARYELIDGERRWRAYQALAARSPGTAPQAIPARVLHATELEAQVIAATIDAARKGRRPVEVAFGLQRLRTALSAERGEVAASLRDMAELPLPYQKTQIGQYLAAADALTPAVLAAADLLTADGAPDLASLCVLEFVDLRAIAARRVAGPELCAAELLRRLDARQAGERPIETSAPAGAGPERNGAASGALATLDAAPPATVHARRVDLLRSGGLSLALRQPVERLAPERARTLLDDDLIPALLAVGARACSGDECDGSLVAISAEHALLVAPSGLGALTLPQLHTFDARLRELLARTRAAVRHRKSYESEPTTPIEAGERRP